MLWTEATLKIKKEYIIHIMCISYYVTGVNHMILGVLLDQISGYGYYKQIYASWLDNSLLILASTMRCQRIPDTNLVRIVWSVGGILQEMNASNGNLAQWKYWMFFMYGCNIKFYTLKINSVGLCSSIKWLNTICSRAGCFFQLDPEYATIFIQVDPNPDVNTKANAATFV